MFKRRLGTAAIAAVAAALLTSEANAANCVRGVESWDTLRIRSSPGPGAREVGHIPPGACGVNIVGACRGWWCPVSWRGRNGWSHSSYLARPGPFTALGMPAWGAAAPTARDPRRSAARKTIRTARDAAPAQTAAIARPAKDAPRASAESEPKQLAAPPPQKAATPTPPLPKPAAPPPIAVQAPPAPPAPPPVTSLIAPAAAAAAAPPAASAAPAAAAVSEACVVDVPKEDTLKVRAGPGLDQALRFGFPSGACGVKITGACAEGWCPVDYRGYRGWAEQKFLK